ncbi:MAG: 4-hydroxythreonine-4-phosphate dehydrogenase PdxA [Fluviibacter sp.]
MTSVRLAITSGEPAGIGPDLCLRLAERAWADELVVLCDQQLLATRAAEIGIQVRFRAYDPTQPIAPSQLGEITVCDIKSHVPVVTGVLNPVNSEYVIALLDRAISGCRSNEFAAMVTAPLHKGVINEAGRSFTGHTEYLAEQTETPLVVMMLAGDAPHGPLRVALVTTHLPLSAVPAAITTETLSAVIRILDHDLRTKFGLSAPRVLVAGLNPHAGEGGHMGHEEIDTIIPTLEKLRVEGMHLIGPLPADTLFTPRVVPQGVAVLALYHDQGLGPLKYATFGQGINITLGLPIIRTSVDHGTALDLAGRRLDGTAPVADPGSLYAAVTLAAQLSRKQSS